MSPSPSSYDALLRRLVYSDARNISSAKQSPLHIAAAGHNKPAIALLLDSGMDPTVLDEEGVDVVVRASKSNFRDRDLWGEKASILANLPDLDKFGQTFYMLLDLFRDRRGKESTASTIAMPGVDKSRVIDGDTALRNLLEGNFLELNRTSRLTRIRAASDLVASEFANINTRDRFGRTLLMVAVADGHDTIVPTLIKYGAKIETDDLAAVWIDWNITRDNKLYQKGETSAIYRLLCTFDVEKRILRDPWFFAYAMYERQDDVIKLMINDLEAPHPILTGGEAWEKLSGEVHDIISVIEEDDNRSDATRNSVLCQPPKRFPRNGSSLVQVAVELDYQFVVEKLIKEYGLAANQFDPDGQSLFHIVVRYKTFESDQMIRLLRRLGADINTTDVNGDSPLSLHCKELLCFGDRYKGSACFIDFFGCRVLESLVLCGSKPSLRNNEGETVLELMDRIRNHAEQVPFNLQGILHGKLLYHVMLYRQSIGM
ncbi:ankyrin [Colletotrichum sublineola]|nr:ankyrin [Colletotrichum sublineola]